MPELTGHELNALLQGLAGGALMLSGALAAFAVRRRADEAVRQRWQKALRLLGGALLGYLLLIGNCFIVGILGPEGSAGAILLGGTVFAGGVLTLVQTTLGGAAARKLELEREWRQRQVEDGNNRQYRKAVATLEDKNKLLEGIVSHIPSHVFWKTTERVYVGCNEGFLDLLGLKNPRELIGRTDQDLPWSAELAKEIAHGERRVLKSGQGVLDREVLCTDTRNRSLTCLMSLIPMKDGFGAVTGILGILKDITARKESENAQHKLNRALQTLSAGSAAIVHASTEEQLIAQMCRLAVELGDYRLAWIGFVGDDEPGVLRQVAQHYKGQGVHETSRTDVPLSGDGSACELISRAVKQGRYTLVRKTGVDHWSKACRHLGRVDGYGAAIALPLVLGGKNLGAMALYAGDPQAFDQDEVQLLCDLAANLAHGIGARREARLRREAEQALAQERAFLQKVIDGVADPTMVIGTDHRILLMNLASRAYLPEGQAPTDLRCHQVIHRRDRPCSEAADPCPLREVQRTGKNARAVHRHTLGEGRERTYEIEASPLWNADGSLRGIIQSARDISDRLAAEASLRENQDRLDHLAHHDPLTNLPNRLLFNNRLKQAMDRAQAEGTQLALMFLDLDRFKKINDSLGHEIGDQVLREVSSRLQRCLRGSDTVARLGGDEFVVTLDQIEDLKTVAVVARNILRAMSRAFRAGTQELYVSTSIGISLFPGDAEDLENLMKHADVAMYRAKDEGRNNYQFYRPEMNLRTREMLVMESNLRRAMEENQLRLFYQPQFNLDNKQLVGFEALLRWEHPEHGMVSPADFIPLAEETGLIVPLGQWVLHTACRQAREWQRQGYAPVRMAVNISAREFRQPDFVDNLDDIIAAADLDPHWLELEITESIAMQNFEETIMTLTDLKIRGVHLAIDDFGTGYSSLGYLKRFPISKLKIDQSFVRDINRDSNDAAIAGSIIALGRSMNMEVIAEGVEREEQAQLLREKGCHQGQGYLYSKAVPTEKAETFLAPQGTTGRSTVIRPPQFSKNPAG